MKGSLGTSASTHYRFPKLPKRTYKLGLVEKLSEKAKIKFKAISLYESGRYTTSQICEIFEIDRSTFYRWRKSYNSHIIQSLQDKSRRPKRVRHKMVRTYEVEHAVCEIRRKYPYFGKEKIQRILEREHSISVSASSVGRILTTYKSILPKSRVAKKRVKGQKKNKIRIKDIHQDLTGKIAEHLQLDTIELNLKFMKAFIFAGIDPISKLLYMRAYRRNTSISGRDFLRRLRLLHDESLRYVQIDNGSEFALHFEEYARQNDITLIHNYPKSPKMNPFVEKANDTIQVEYLDRFYEETSIKEINRILFDCLIEYNFYRPHRSLGLLTPIEFAEQKTMYNKSPPMLHMYRTQSRSTLLV